MGDVELEVDQNQIIIRPVLNPRAGWDEAFDAMTKTNDDVLLDGNDNLSHSWDEEEWQW
jgi:antitoxin MazE